MRESIPVRLYCVVLTAATLLSPISSAGTLDAASAPEELQPSGFVRLFDLQNNLVGTPSSELGLNEILQPDLARTPGLNANERAIARSLDRIDARILRNGLNYLNPLRLPISEFRQDLFTTKVFVQGAPFSHRIVNRPHPPGFQVVVFPTQEFDRAFDITAYEMAAYGKKDAGIANQGFALLLPLNEALDRLSPEQLTVMPSLALAFANEQSLALEERLAQIRGDVFELKALPYMGKEASAKETPPAPLAPSEKWGAFIDGSGDFADVDNTHEARGYDFTQGTVTLGAYYHFTNSFTAGIMASYAGSDASLADQNGRVEANSMEAAAFATWSRGGFHLDAIAGGGYNSYDINTYFGVEKVGTRFEPNPVHATTDGGFGDWLLGTGYDFHIGRFVTGPIASLEYTHVSINSFSEIANTAPGSEAVAEFSGLSSKDAAKLVNPVLKVMPQDVDSMKSTLGWTVSLPLDLGKQKLTPTVSAFWQHEYMDQQYGINAAFPFAPGDPFTVHGPALGRDMLLFQAGVILRVNERFSMYANYLGTFARQNYSSNAIEGGARLAF